MAAALSNLTQAELLELNRFALSDAPSAMENLNRRIAELSSRTELNMLGLAPRGTIVIAGCEIDRSDHYHVLEAVLDFPPEMRNPVEEVTACVCLLRCLDLHVDRSRPLAGTSIESLMQHPISEVQRRLSHLLVEYPVLMDQRLLIGVTTPREDFIPIAHALAEASFASLPRLSHGLTSRQLRLFAANRCVKDGLTNPAPTGRRARDTGRTVLGLLAGELHTPIASRGGFLTSLMQLSRHARELTGRPLLAMRTAPAATQSRLYRNLATLFWDQVVSQGAASSASRKELVEALRLPSLYAKAGREAGTDDQSDFTVATTRVDQDAHSRLYRALEYTLDSKFFGVECSHDSDEGKAETCGLAEMGVRTLRAIDLLVECGAASTANEAARTLADMAIGAGRGDVLTAGPLCSPEQAMGFLQALHVNGVGELLGERLAAMSATPSSPAGRTGTAVLTASGKLVANIVAKRAESEARALATWLTAIHAVITTKAMEAVFSASDSQPQAASGAAGSTPSGSIGQRQAVVDQNPPTRVPDTVRRARLSRRVL